MATQSLHGIDYSFIERSGLSPFRYVCKSNYRGGWSNRIMTVYCKTFTDAVSLLSHWTSEYVTYALIPAEYELREYVWKHMESGMYLVSVYIDSHTGEWLPVYSNDINKAHASEREEVEIPASKREVFAGLVRVCVQDERGTNERA